MPDDVVLDAVHLVPAGARENRGGVEPRPVVDVGGVQGFGRSVGAGDVVRGGRGERRGNRVDRDGGVGGNGDDGDDRGARREVRVGAISAVRCTTGTPWERGVAAAPFCFDLALNAPCAPTNPRNP